MEDIEATRFTKGRYAAFALWIMMIFTIVLVIVTMHQIHLIRSDESFLGPELAIGAISFFAIVLPVLFTIILIPSFISSIKWFNGRYTKFSKAAAVASIVISILYSADLGLITLANLSDGYYIQGGVELVGIGLAIFLIVRCILFMISMKGYGVD